MAVLSFFYLWKTGSDRSNKSQSGYFTEGWLIWTTYTDTILLSEAWRCEVTEQRLRACGLTVRNIFSLHFQNLLRKSCCLFLKILKDGLIHISTVRYLISYLNYVFGPHHSEKPCGISCWPFLMGRLWPMGEFQKHLRRKCAKKCPHRLRAVRWGIILFLSSFRATE